MGNRHVWLYTLIVLDSQDHFEAMWYLSRILAQLRIIAEHFVTIGKIVWSYARTHVLISSFVGVVVLVGIGTFIYFTATTPELITPGLRTVTLVRVGDVLVGEPLSVIGEIRATSEANISADSSGTVRGVYRSLGDFVGAGAIIAELDNSVQKAQVAQAEAALEKVKGASGAGQLSVESAQESYATALSSGRNTIQNAYAAINDAVERKTDALFSNPKTNPRFIPATSNAQLVLTVESGRTALRPILARHETAGAAPSTADAILDELENLSRETTAAQEYLSTLILALNAAIPTSVASESAIATYRADASVVATSITGLKSAILSAIENIKVKRTQVSIAASTLAQGSTGKSADVLAAEAALDAARAGLEKTIIRAPISGTINRLDLDVGNFVSASVPVVYIANARALEAIVYVSGQDLPSIVRGSKASIAGLAEGTVSRVASALDPVTKKAEIRITIPSDAPFVSGQSATLMIARKPIATESQELSIPIAALKITPEGPTVFTVLNNILVENPVVLGQLRGSTVVVESGLIPDMRIVEDARGLKKGQRIEVAESGDAN